MCLEIFRYNTGDSKSLKQFENNEGILVAIYGADPSSLPHACYLPKRYQMRDCDYIFQNIKFLRRIFAGEKAKTPLGIFFRREKK